MNGLLIFCLFLLAFLFLIIFSLFIMKGISLCKKNNAIGIFILFCFLSVFGVILGLCILYNYKNGMYNDIESKNLLEKEVQDEDLK